MIQGKWAILILYQLSGGPLRFNELLRRIEIAQGTPSNQLKALERDGMVSRTVKTDGVVSVEYALMPIGKKFQKVLDAIEDWGNEYIDFLKEREAAE